MRAEPCCHHGRFRTAPRVCRQRRWAIFFALQSVRAFNLNRQINALKSTCRQRKESLEPCPKTKQTNIRGGLCARPQRRARPPAPKKSAKPSSSSPPPPPLPPAHLSAHNLSARITKLQQDVRRGNKQQPLSYPPQCARLHAVFVNFLAWASGGLVIDETRALRACAHVRRAQRRAAPRRSCSLPC